MKRTGRKTAYTLRGSALLLALFVLLSLAGCGKKTGTAGIRADFSGRVATLDPQYCTTTLERCILKNCMEGLLRRLPDGSFVLDREEEERRRKAALELMDGLFDE